MIVDFIILYGAVALSVPLVTGYFAKTRGRSFVFWFALCLVLPFISMFILMCLPEKISPEMKDSGMDSFEEQMMQRNIKNALSEDKSFEKETEFKS